MTVFRPAWDYSHPTHRPISIFLVPWIIAACGGGSENGPTDELDPYITFFGAEPANPAYGGATTLTWASVETTSCAASGGWDGPKATSGSETISGLVRTTQFNLRCLGGQSSDDASLVVSVPTVTSAPKVTLFVDPENLLPEGIARLVWAASPALGCVASGGWSGAKSAVGSQLIGPLTTNTTYTIDCSNELGTTRQSVEANILETVNFHSFTFLENPDDLDHSTFSPVPGNPVEGVNLAAATLSGPVSTVTFQFVSNEHGGVISEDPLDTDVFQEGSGFTTYHAATIVPNEPFFVRASGTMQSGQTFTEELSHIYHPSKVSIRFIELGQAMQGSVNVVDLAVHYHGTPTDAEQVRVYCSSYPILTLDPVKQDLVLDAQGAARFSLQISVASSVSITKAKPKVRCLATVISGIASGTSNYVEETLSVHDVIAPDN